MQRLIKDSVDFIHIGFIGIGSLKMGDFLLLNDSGESILLKNIFILLGCIAFVIKIFLMIRKKKDVE